MDHTPRSMRSVRTADDVFRLMDGLFGPAADRWTDGAADWWDRFYSDRTRGVPFFASRPDESLASWLDRGLVTPGIRGRALDLGCGPGRNTLHLARHGFAVDAVDLSPTALRWARERAEEAGVEAAFHRADAFTLTESDLDGPYDLIYDSGCFHHLPPHRRVGYLAFLDRFLAPGGAFGLSCFATGAANSGTELSDLDLYRDARAAHGGVAYGDDDLRWIFSELTEVELRRMRRPDPDAETFGEAFLWAGLFRRPRRRA